MDKARLRDIPLFADLSDDDLDVVTAFAQEKSVSEGEELVREGDFAYEFMIIEEGSAEVSRDGETLATLGPGDFFGETGVMAKEMRSATVRATSRMMLLVLTSFDLKRLQKLPGINEKIEQAVNSRSSG